MALTTIDATPALVVIDLQKGIVALPTAHPVDDVVRNSAELAAAFRRHGFPVYSSTSTAVRPAAPRRRHAAATGPRTGPSSSGLDPQPDDLRVTKRTWGAFHGTTLDEQLRARGVTQVVLTGVATSAGVESTARAAHEHGYHVVLATDAMTDRSAEVHANSVERISRGSARPRRPPRSSPG